jgi:hypothetical protein
VRAAVAFGLAGLAVVSGAVYLVWTGDTTAAKEAAVLLWLPFLLAVAVSWVLWRRRLTGASKGPAWALVFALLIISVLSGYYIVFVFPIALGLAIATAVAPGPARA